MSSLIWKILERGGTQGIQFVLSIVLARLVSPDNYGLISLVSIFIQISSVFVTSGLGTALVQQKDADDVSFSSVFFLGLFIACCCYVLLFFVAPYIASFYEADSLIPIIRVLGISLFFGAVNNVQGSFVSKHMQFKRFFFSSIGSVAGSGIIGIVLAYKGFGVWAGRASFWQLKNNGNTKRLKVRHTIRCFKEFFGDFIPHKYNGKMGFVVEVCGFTMKGD